MITSTGALILLVVMLPIAVWASMADLARLKIPNKAVLVLGAVWPLVGWLAVPTWTLWFWGFALFAIVFVLGYLLYLTGTFGAGDAKYASVIAPVFVGADIVLVLFIISVSLIGALVLHRILRGIPALRARTPDWKSWTERRYFPLGLALSLVLVLYLLAAIWPQV